MVLHVTLLAEEWTQSAKGGTCSILNRQLAIHLAQHPDVQVGLLIPKCSPEDRQDAEKYQISIIEPEECPGADPVYLLGILPEGFSTDFIIGHDIKLGWQGNVIRQKCGCKWIHVVHTNAEEMGLYMPYPGAISSAEEEHENQVKLCESADMVVTIGPKLKDSFSSSLSFLGKKIFNLTPGIFDEFCNICQEFQDRKTCKTLIFGRGDVEDFELKGLDVAAKAVATLDDPTYHLMVVGAPDGRQEELANKLCSHGITRNQLIVRRFYKDRKQLADLFWGVDLLLMPSGTEAFGLAALEALSAGVPFLVTSNSGLAEALREVPLGAQSILESNADLAKEIKKAWINLKIRQEEAKILRERFKKKYSWKEQCAALVEEMRSMHDPVPQQLQSDAAEREATNSRLKRKVPCSSYDPQSNENKAKALKLMVGVEIMKPAEHNTQDRTPVSATEAGGSPELGHQETSAVPVSSGHAHPLSTGAEVLQAPNPIPTEGEVLRLIASNYLMTTPPRCKDEHDEFLTYLKKMSVVLTGVSVGSLVITVKCDSLQILEELWKDYSSGDLGAVVQRCFVTEEILREFSLAELKLKTTILEEEYKACKVYFEKNTARGQLCEIVAASDVTEKPGHFTDEKISTETDNKETDNKEDLPTETDGENTKFKPVEDDSVSADEDKCESVAVPEEEPVNFVREEILKEVDDDYDSESWTDQVHRIVYAGLEMFDVSSPKGLQDYLIYFYDWMYSEGLRLLRGYNSSRKPSWTTARCEAAPSTGSDSQGDEKEASTVLVQKTAKPGKESPSVKNLTKVMDDDWEQFVSIHVKEGAWQVVVWVLDELLHRGVPSRIISAAKREGWETNDDAESDDSQLVALTWWPTNEDQELVTLCKVLTESDCKLISLNLSFNFQITDAGVKHLAEALMHSNCKLNNLDLSCNDAITDAGVKHLAEALMHTNCNLNSLDLRGNDAITDAGVKHLAEALMHSNCSLNSLNLTGNDAITDAGVKHLADALMHSNCNLNSLNLSRNKNITDAGVKHLADALMHSNCKLNSLNFSYNDAITDAGVKHLAEALMHSNCKLNSLNFSYNDAITDAGVKHLAEALMHSNCKLNSLNFSYNDAITDAGVKHLAEALMHSNRKLNSLNLSWNRNITDAGVKHLAEALMHSNCSLNSLNLSRNRNITDAGVKHLAEALMHSNCSLNSLNLSGNYAITDAGVKHLAEALMHSNYELRSVSPRRIKVTAKVQEHVSEEGLG
ncbi:uncharacterized protein LOC144632801 isoform X1 [Oculina patagonica]